MKKYFNMNDTKSITTYLERLLGSTSKNYTKITVLCIGTDRSTGDSLGPLIGTFLKEQVDLPYEVLGTLEDPVHAKNLEIAINGIDDNNLVIAIDACLGKMDHVGYITVSEGGIKPGSGVGKDLPVV